jgi:putative intracellular protease/amidase
MRLSLARILLVPLLIAGCQKASAAPSAAAPSASPDAMQAAIKRPTVGILVYDGVQVIDYSGPFEIFGQAGFDVFTVAKHNAPVTTAMGQVITPRHGFAEAPPLDILVVPGGGPAAVAATQKDAEVQAFIRAAQPRARHIMSVCNGALILGQTGLLDGKGATTFHGQLAELQALVPSAKVVNDKRFVDNGQLITTAGLSAGIDGALHVLEKDEGRGMAQMVALGVEYDWHPEGTYARAKLADMNILRALHGTRLTKLTIEGALKFERTEGDDRTWTMVMTISQQGDAAAVMKMISPGLLAAGWQPSTPATDTDRGWTFKDPAGRSWKGRATTTDASGAVRLELHVDLNS